MREPRLQKFTVVSLIVHMTFFLMAIVIMRYKDTLVVPAPYIVSLVGSETEKPPATAKSPAPVQEKAPQTNASSQVKSPDNAREYASDRIAALKAKKKLEEIVKLRNIISLKGSATSGEESVGVSQPSEGKDEGAVISSYIKKIGEEIRQQWVFPEFSDKKLEAIIAVTIKKDGTIMIRNAEKKSGDPLFDRSVLNAIRKASPVSQPPYEMEIGLRFTP